MRQNARIARDEASAPQGCRLVASRVELHLAALVAAVLLAGPNPSLAASTGTAGLLTIQGSGAPLSNGDYIASNAGAGLDTFHSFFIEVPAGLPQLDVDLFDADIGAGGAGEAAAGRDRDRSGWDTSVAYSLRAPNGSVTAVRFATGDTAAPAAADNAWLTLFSSVGTFRDEFGTVAYSNSDGTSPWSTNWTETGDGGGGAGGGEIRIVNDSGNNRLRVERNSRSVEREANLNGATAASLSFVYRRVGLDDSGEYVAIEASGDGGGSWTELARFAGPGSDGSYTAVSYSLTPYLASNTRIRFISSASVDNNELVYFDDVEIATSGVVAGHWELRVDESSTETAGDDINALGIRAHDGTSGSGGTEVAVYAHSFLGYGSNGPTITETYTHHPYITSGCVADSNNFDWDTDSGATGSLVYTSRSGVFTNTIGTPSADSAWQNSVITGWTSDTEATDYGVWELDATIRGYNPGANGNYAIVYLGDSLAASPPPTTQPQANTFRVYLATDAGSAPAKPYLEQLVRHSCGTGSAGPNPPNVGQTSCFTVTVRLVNPAAEAVTFSTPSNIVTANVPGAGATYGGGAAVSQGSIISQPAIGATGNITWNPGTVAAGATALLAYRVNVLPTSVGQRIRVTATPASGNGTRGQFVDGTGNTTQSRATYLAGPLCELAVTEDVITEAVVASFSATRTGEGVVVSFTTVSEVATVGFDLYRWSAVDNAWHRVNAELVPARLEAPQGSTYEMADVDADPGAVLRYRLVEVEANGNRRWHGPFFVVASETQAVQAEEKALPVGFAEPFSAAPDATVATRAGISSSRRMPAAAAQPAKALRLGVSTNGLHLVSRADLLQLLENKEQKLDKLLAAGKLSLTRSGEEVAWVPAPDGAGLLFYGEAPTGEAALHAATSVYRLEKGVAGRLMEETSAGSPLAVDGGSFVSRAVVEEDRLAATVVVTDADTDWWFWDFLVAGDPGLGARSFVVAAADPVGTGDVELRVSLHGASATGLADEHHVLVRVNGVEVGEGWFAGLAAFELAIDLPAAVLVAGDNTVEVEARLDPGIPYGLVYVDGFELSYRRWYRAAQGELALSSEDHEVVSVDGLADSRVIVLDLADPLRPRILRDLGFDGAAGDTRVSFVPAASDRPYLVASPLAWRAPASVRSERLSSLAGVDAADYLVLTTTELLAPARALANRRRSQGLRSAVVDVQDVYDRYTQGMTSPKAIRQFLADIAVSWSPAPRYVVLAGAGSFDYRDRLGFGAPLLPPLLVPTSHGLFASDSRFADVIGDDGVPDLAIGRIPARTAAELAAYVAKVASYESAAGSGWDRRALLLADDAEGGVDFAMELAELAQALPANYLVESLAYDGGLPDPLREDLLGRLRDGVSVFAYLGHSGLDRLAAEGLLLGSDLSTLGNGTRLPIVTALTCVVNRFELPGFTTLGSALVIEPNGGAAAVWAPSGTAWDATSRALGKRFFSGLGAPGADRLGDVVTAAVRAYLGQGGLPAAAEIYHLLGDPALVVRRPQPDPPGGGGQPGTE